MGYFKKNCRWVTQKDQGRNRRDNVLITANGKTMALTAWAEELGVSGNALRIRKSKGWSDSDIVSIPVKIRLEPRNVVKIYRDGTSGKMTLLAVAGKYKLPFSTVQAITSGRNWASVTGVLR